ncbi:MAG TPA: CDP-diacylglycerol--glycerol-3-phosphate 3-phosphatidyltransferase [Actinomycetota bacterium]
MISGLRILLVPVLVVLVLVDSDPSRWAAAAVFAGGGISDFFDGYLARRQGTTTRTGMWLDPLSDKLLVSAAVISLVAVDRFPVWAAVVILAREVAVTVLRAVRGTRGESMPATFVAKTKTASQLLAIALYLMPLPHWLRGVKLGVLIVAVALTLYSGVDYFVRAFRSPASARTAS